MKTNITNRNKNNQHHGYQEWYTGNSISFRGIFKYNKTIGYIEWHNIEFTVYNIT